MNIYVLLIVNAIFVNNFIFSQFLGICPFLGVSKKTETALGMGTAVTFVMGVSSILTYAVNILLLKLDVAYIQTIVFILVIAALVQVVEMVIKKFTPSLYSALGVYLPLITTNCAVLGVAIMNVTNFSNFSILKAFINGTASGLGFMLAIVLLAGIRERMEFSEIPESFRGFPITLICAGIMSMAFTAFAGMVF